MKPVRCGVWGVGVWGEKHARVYGAIRDAELVGVYDQSRARAEEVVKQHGGRAFDTPEALLAGCEAVSVATPTVAHLEATERAGYKPGSDVRIAIDAAASEFYANGKYVIEGRPRTSREMDRPKLTAWTTARLMPLTGTITRCSRCGPGRIPSSRTASSASWRSY